MAVFKSIYKDISTYRHNYGAKMTKMLRRMFLTNSFKFINKYEWLLMNLKG